MDDPKTSSLDGLDTAGPHLMSVSDCARSFNGLLLVTYLSAYLADQQVSVVISLFTCTKFK